MTDVIEIINNTLVVPQDNTELIEVGYIAQTVAEGGGPPIDTSGFALKPYVRSAYIISGDITPLPNTASTWQTLMQAGTGQPFELAIPAAVGEWVEISASFMAQLAANSFLDIGVMVGTSVVRSLSSGTAIPAVEGDPALYPNPSVYRASGFSKGFTVTSGDLDAARVRFVLSVKGVGTGSLYASTAFPFYWRAVNHRTVN